MNEGSILAVGNHSCRSYNRPSVMTSSSDPTCESPTETIFASSRGIVHLSTIVFLLAFFALLRRTKRIFDLVRGTTDKPHVFREEWIESWSDDEDFVELDERKRAAVLRQPFSPEKIPDNLDAVLIGSGVGSLSTAALLARAGKIVLVLEQHDKAGGCCHSFVEKGYEFDVGIHYVGGMGHGDAYRVLMDQMTGGRLKWDKLDDVYDVAILGKEDEKRRYNIKGGSKRIWEDELIKHFPMEEAAVRKFSNACEEASRSLSTSVFIKFVPYWLAKILLLSGVLDWFSNYSKWNKVTVKEFVNSLTENKDLRVIFQYLFGDYGTLPEKASFFILGLLHDHYFQAGAFYPRGGASEIPFHIIKEIQRMGGAVLVRAKVVSILLDPGRSRAIGIRVQKGSSTHDVFSPIVISGAGYENTVKKLLPGDVSMRLGYMHDVKYKVSRSLSSFHAFLGFDVKDEKIDIPKQNRWIFRDPDDDIENVTRKYLSLSREEVQDVDPPFVFIGFPSSKDSTYARRFPGKIACTVIAISNYQWVSDWQKSAVKKRGDEYEGIKNSIGQRLLDITLEEFPQLRDKLELIVQGTGLTADHYLGKIQGETYGLDHDAKRFSLEVQAALRPESGLKGLFLTGQDISSVGCVPALLTAMLTASSILDRNLFAEQDRYRERILKLIKSRASKRI